jgi:hypothetical protein
VTAVLDAATNPSLGCASAWIRRCEEQMQVQTLIADRDLLRLEAEMPKLVALSGRDRGWRLSPRLPAPTSRYRLPCATWLCARSRGAEPSRQNWREILQLTLQEMQVRYARS